MHFVQSLLCCVQWLSVTYIGLSGNCTNTSPHPSSHYHTTLHPTPARSITHPAPHPTSHPTLLTLSHHPAPHPTSHPTPSYTITPPCTPPHLTPHPFLHYHTTLHPTPPHTPPLLTLSPHPAPHPTSHYHTKSHTTPPCSITPPCTLLHLTLSNHAAYGTPLTPSPIHTKTKRHPCPLSFGGVSCLDLV